jgi:hypothetical protein
MMAAVAVKADYGLQRRCGEGGSEGNEANLAEIQMKGVAQERINRREE